MTPNSTVPNSMTPHSMTPHSIAVGFGELDSSQGAVRWAAEQCRQRGCWLHLVTVGGEHAAAGVREALEGERRAILAERPEVAIAVDVLDGAPTDALQRAAQHADLLVIGALTSRGLRLLVHDGDAATLAAQDVCPVVLVPASWDAVRGGIVVGLADDTSSDRALRRAAELAVDTGASLTIVHAWRTASRSVQSLWRAREAHEERLARAVRLARVGHEALRIAAALHEGPPGDALRAAARDASLVVLGTHRAGILPALIHGSLADEVLENARTPLCIVSQQAHPSASTVPDGSPGRALIPRDRAVLVESGGHGPAQFRPLGREAPGAEGSAS